MWQKGQIQAPNNFSTPCLGKCVIWFQLISISYLIWFHSIFFYFNWFHMISFDFIWFRCISFDLISFNFIFIRFHMIWSHYIFSWFIWLHSILYFMSKLVRALWLVNLAGRTLLHSPLKFKVVSVAKLLRDLSPKLLNLFSKWRFKTFF